ncbi:hypothetical protein Dimus_037321, partial [Dionaea muscipula]
MQRSAVVSYIVAKHEPSMRIAFVCHLRAWQKSYSWNYRAGATLSDTKLHDSRGQNQCVTSLTGVFTALASQTQIFKSIGSGYSSSKGDVVKSGTTACKIVPPVSLVARVKTRAFLHHPGVPGH